MRNVVLKSIKWIIIIYEIFILTVFCFENLALSNMVFRRWFLRANNPEIFSIFRFYRTIANGLKRIFITGSCVLFRGLFVGLGVLFLLALIISFTTLPFWGYYWLGTSKSKITEKPDFIVLLSGGGMPSESNLMRAFFCV